MPNSTTLQPAPQARNEVFSAINNEREYQEVIWCEATTPTKGLHTPTEYLVYINHYQRKAEVAASTMPDPDASVAILDNLRKVAALAVACMEQNGVVWRDPDQFPAGHVNSRSV
jgi:hypothetical protein